MSKFLILLITVFPLMLVAKETKKIVRERHYPDFTETFYVLKSDTSVKHGGYKALTQGHILVTGHFNLGYMDSIWTQYNLKGKIRSKGWFEKGKRDSIWEFFNPKGELEQKIDFTHGELLYYQTSLAKHPFRVILGTDSIVSILDRPPLFIGGISRFNDYVTEELNIPLHKRGEKVNGIVYLSFTIDSLGKTSNYRVLKGIGKTCNSEALRVMKMIPDDWIPGQLNGKNVTVDYLTKFQFDQNVRTIDPEFIEMKK